MTAPGGRREAVLAREAGHLRGNRLWRVETAAGPVLQKFYCAKAGPVADAWRSMLSGPMRGITPSSADARWRTEREILALWAAAGLAVPRDRTAEFPALAGERVAILEWIEGRDLLRMLEEGALARPERDALLRRWAAEWGRRQKVAVDRKDSRFAQVHGTLVHYLVTPDRIVCIDHEQAWLPGQEALPALAREAAGCLRSLAKRGDAATVTADLAAIAAGHPDRALLKRIAGAIGDLRFVDGDRKELARSLAGAL